MHIERSAAMNRRIARLIGVTFLSIIAVMLIISAIKPTRSMVIEIVPSSVPRFEAMIATNPSEMKNIEILHSPGTALWMLSTSDVTEIEVDRRTSDLTDFLQRWGVAEYTKHGRCGIERSAIIEHDRSKGNFQKLINKYFSPAPYFR
jgi:hypothetical protein